MRRILVVDDEQAILEALQDILESEGWSVTTALHGQDALHKLEAANATPDVVLMDLMMPVMDGRVLMHRLAESPRFARVPRVVMSAGRIRDEDTRLATRFLAKPFDLDALLAVLDEVCGRGRAA